jgi:hypothetical protein
LYFPKNYYYHCMVFTFVPKLIQIKLPFMNKMKLLLTLAIPVVVLCQDAQAQSSRLTAQANWTHNGAEFKRNDSTAYNYFSTSRGGDLNSQLKFDDASNWSFVMGDTQNNNMRWVQEFDASNNLVTKVSQEWDMIFTMSWVNKFKYIYSYNSSNMKTSMVTQHWDGTSAWITDSKNVYTYNAANQLSTDLFLLWDGVGAYVSNKNTAYYYDASGNVINETMYTFVASTPVFTSEVNYTYDAGNRVLTTTNAVWNGAGWDNTDMTTNTYDSAGNRTTQLMQNYDGSVFVNDMLHIYSNFTGGHPQTEIAQSWDTTGSGSWVDMHKYAYTYNSHHQMTSATSQSYDISIGWTQAFGDTKSNYYYGSYVAGVKNISNAGGTASLYPVPTQSVLNIDVKWNQAQSATIIISDMQGKTVKSMTTQSGTSAHASVDVANFAEGIYLVRIVGTEGQIVKQIVVAH